MTRDVRRTLTNDVRRTLTDDVRRTVGAALPIMLLMLALTSALVVGGVFVTRQVIASVRASEHAAAVEPAAEMALVDAIAQWDTTQRALQPVGLTQPLSTYAGVGVSTSVWATRLSARSYWLVAESRDGTRPVLCLRLGVLVQITNAVAAPVRNRAWTPLP
jgi:hypothetical protein